MQRMVTGGLDGRVNASSSRVPRGKCLSSLLRTLGTGLDACAVWWCQVWRVAAVHHLPIQLAVGDAASALRTGRRQGAPSPRASDPVQVCPLTAALGAEPW